MRQMMVHETHPRAGRTKCALEKLRAGLLVPHADKMSSRIQHVRPARRPSARRIHLQVVPVNWPRRLPSEAHFVQFVGAHSGEFQASFNRKLWKARVVLQAAQPFLGHRKQQLPIAHDARGRIVHL